MQHILILRELSDQELNHVRFLSNKEDVLVIGYPHFIESIDHVKPWIELSEAEKKKINYKTLNEVLDFGDTIVNGQSISGHLQIGGAGLWYYHKFRIYFKVRNLQYKIDEIRKNLVGSNTGKIYINDGDYLSRFIDPSRYKIYSSGRKRNQRISVSSILQYGFTVIIRFIISIITPIYNFNKKEIVFIDTVNQYRQILSLDGSTTIFENAFLGYLLQKKGGEIGFIDQLLIPKFKGVDRYRFQLKHIKNYNKRTRLFGERIMFVGLWSIKSIRGFLSAVSELKAKYNLLNKEIGRDSVNTKYLSEVISLHSSSLLYLYKFFAYKKFFSGRKIKTIFTTDENSVNFKVILEAARLNKIQTVGYQHGSIHDLHPAYIYSKADMTQNPIPDLTITWGKKWTDLLISKGNYPKSKIAVAGQIRTDIIKNLQNNPKLTSSAIIKKSDQMRIVLFATQPQRDPALRLRAAEDVVKACKDLDSTHLVFKLHPRENDPEYYEEVARRYSYENYTISRDEELYILLHIADVVITCFSTVGSEALYFKKPLIILDHLRQDILNYHRDQVAFQATNSNELRILIEKIMKGDLLINLDILTKYLEESTYRIDGLVSERVWDLVSSKKHFQS